MHKRPAESKDMKKELFVAFLFIIFFIGLCLGIRYLNKNRSEGTKKADISPESESSSSASMKGKTMPKPTMQIDVSKNYQAILTTSVGDITIELTAVQTPITVNNFVYLARNHFYDNTIFHRVIKDFMIQGGDPKGNGSGGPGYQFDDEPFSGDYTRGTVAMANAGKNTNGSQFFIMHQDYNLSKDYVIFGHVVAGIDVVDKIADSPVKQSPSGEQSMPVSPVTVRSVQIIEQ